MSEGNGSGGWGSKFFKAASAVPATTTAAGGLYAFLRSSSSYNIYEAVSPFESRSPHVNKEPAPSSQVQCAKPDPAGWVRQNVDGSHDDEGLPSSNGCGGVVRDDSDEWLKRFAQRLATFGLDEAEIQAILKDLELAWERNLAKKLVVESDRESVENGPQFGLISQIKKLLSDPNTWQELVKQILVAKFLKVAGANAATAAVAGGLFAFLSFACAPRDTPSSRDQWTKPSLGWVKLNVNGSRCHIGLTLTPSTGCGGVLRDSSGTWVYGFARRLKPTFKIHEAEILAILMGLKLAQKMNVEKLVVESDNEPLVSKVLKGPGCKSIRVIEQIRKLCFEDPKWHVEVVHIPREANRVANRLANNARELPDEDLRKYRDPPKNCTRLLEEDAQPDRTQGAT